jgi:SAM-dependent methyltransferase
VNTKFGSEVMDLNLDLRQRYGYRMRFDLVTNNGTGEHIFNQHAVFKNVHQLCVPGGVMLHILPFIPWVNHGFYNYNPVLFRDLGAANGYETLFLWVGDRWGERADLTDEPWVFREKHPKELSAVLRQFQNDVFVVCAYRKVRDSGFKVPMQGKYVGDIETEELRARYS